MRHATPCLPFHVKVMSDLVPTPGTVLGAYLLSRLSCHLEIWTRVQLPGVLPPTREGG